MVLAIVSLGEIGWRIPPLLLNISSLSLMPVSMVEFIIYVRFIFSHIGRFPISTMGPFYFSLDMDGFIYLLASTYWVSICWVMEDDTDKYHKYHNLLTLSVGCIDNIK